MHGGESVDETLRNTLAEIFEVWIAARIFEGQDRERIHRSGMDNLGGWGDEAVTAARDGLDKTRGSGGVVQGSANLPDTNIQALLKVDEGVFVPELMLNFLSRHELTRPTDEKREELEGLRLKMKLCFSFAQAACAGVQFEGTKSDGPVRG